MRLHCLLDPLAAFPLVCSLALGDVIPGRWEKVDKSNPGSRLFIEMQSGDQFEGTFVSSDSEAVVVQTPDGNKLPLVKNAILRVTRPKQATRTLLGAAIGGGAGVATGLAISSRFDETFFARKDLMGVTCAGIGACVGAAIGSAINRDTDEREVVYQSR